MSNKVFIARCEEYSLSKVESLIEEGLKHFKVSFRKDERILFKPNLLSDAHPDKLVTTNPIILKAMGNILNKIGVKISIGDSPGGQLEEVDSLYDNTMMSNLAKDLNSKLIRFSSYKVRNIVNEEAIAFKKIPITSVLNDFDAFINFPKIKTHNLVEFTAAVKNLFGFVPAFAKANCHKLAPHPVDLCESFVLLYKALKPKINIVDGIYAMEGPGPAGGTLKKLGLILIGDDALVLDVVIAKLMGINQLTSPLFKAFKNAKIEVPDFNDIEIKGLLFNELKLEPFDVPQTSKMMNLIPSSLMKTIGKLVWAYPKPIEKLCVLCQRCEKGCPTDAIKMGEDVAIVDRKKCISCYCCTEHCPAKAINIDYSLVMKIMLWKRKRAIDKQK